MKRRTHKLVVPGLVMLLVVAFLVPGVLTGCAPEEVAPQQGGLSASQ